MSKKKGVTEVRTMSCHKEVHFWMSKGKKAVIEVNTPGGIDKITITNVDGETGVYVTGSGGFIYSGLKDFFGDKGADHLVINSKPKSKSKTKLKPKPE